MITINNEKSNTFLQETYNELIQNIDLLSLPCSCAIKGHLIKHGSYKRTIKSKGKSFAIRIQRVLCKSCGKTHALLTKDIVPYSQISIYDHLLIIEAYLEPAPSETANIYEDIMIDNECISENTIKYIINKYKNFWHQALLSLNLSINNEANFIINKCLTKFRRQFMQIKTTINILFLTNNIS